VKPALKGFLIALLTFAFSMMQAMLILGGTIMDTSANNADDFWALDEIAIAVLPLLPVVVLSCYFLGRRRPKPFLWWIPLIIFIAVYWAFIVNKPVFEDRDAAWSTWEAVEIRNHVILFYLIPGLLLAGLLCRALKSIIKTGNWPAATLQKTD